MVAYPQSTFNKHNNARATKCVAIKRERFAVAQNPTQFNRFRINAQSNPFGPEMNAINFNQIGIDDNCENVTKKNQQIATATTRTIKLRQICN